MRRILFQIGIILFFSCNTKKEQTGPDAVFADYRITAEEGGENVTCLLRFFPNKTAREAVLLEPPAGVRLDGAELAADSAGLSGAYYEVQRPLAAFAGTHALVFKNAAGKEYRETFNFRPFTLAGELGETVLRGNITLQLKGLADATPVRVLLTDTSFATDDINEIDTVQNNAVMISREALRRVTSGPVTLHLFTEEDRPLKNAPAGGGTLSVTYSLRREFDLVDE